MSHRAREVLPLTVPLAWQSALLRARRQFHSDAVSILLVDGAERRICGRGHKGLFVHSDTSLFEYARWGLVHVMSGLALPGCWSTVDEALIAAARIGEGLKINQPLEMMDRGTKRELARRCRLLQHDAYASLDEAELPVVAQRNTEGGDALCPER